MCLFIQFVYSICLFNRFIYGEHLILNMWTDKKNAADHLADLRKVRETVEAERLQYNTPGQISSAQEAKKYRLGVIDKLIQASEAEASPIPQKQGELYR